MHMTRTLLPWLVVLATVSVWGPAQAEPGDAAAELTLRADGRGANPLGPLAAARALQPGLAAAPADGLLLQAELRDTWRWRTLGTGLALHANGLLAHQWLEAGQGQADFSRVNELNASADLGAWQLSAGKKVLGWDVGYGFRPNDVVQQETRRTQFGQTPEGRPLLMAEHFSADTAWSLVWAQPQRWNRPEAEQRGAGESALAARVYRRDGAIDWHGFARLGRHSGASLGAALAWVATDALEIHASWRMLQRHDGWASAAGASATPLTGNPWQWVRRPGTAQWLIGAQWTGEARQSLLVEAWRDGTALPDAQWRDWGLRTAALARLADQQPALAGAVAGNLAWQATPFNAASLRRDNLFARLAWQPEGWQLSLDGLWQPEDGGRIVTAGLQWQGDRWRIDASWRFYGGPDGALLAQLPLRRSAVLAASWAF
ncbi:MAG: hypothetical protein KBC73_19045 [Burkholderiaceae bacterium]|nr:hypothetical protein [Burkholderiaceae bacterium]